MGNFNSKRKDILKFFLTALLSTLIFSGFTFCYLFLCKKTGAVRLQNAENKKNDVPYAESLPENMDINIIFSDESRMLLSLDFKLNKIVLKETENQTEKYIKLNYNSSAEILDSIGGIELSVYGQNVRCTGVQAMNMLSSDSELKNDIISAFFSGLKKIDLTKDNISAILNSTDTNISAIDTYFWQYHINDMLNNFKFINN